ncbi:hypothetical protein QYE76_054738 [Lolium multiflorum]|uniref:Myb/SANT-like domain-containing protein n=1 Tax=Lolium multiflorum TaxID=4521 RepID=A0AAD8WLA0_LOLMU|nr:hypothetical protein QYE76_054738 [Lolium multiflorum]
MGGGIMDDRWRGIGGDDGNDLLQFPVPAGCQNGVSDPEMGFSLAAEFWMASGKLVDSSCVFRSRALSSLEGSVGGWPRRPHHRAARPWAHRAATWCARLVAPSVSSSGSVGLGGLKDTTYVTVEENVAMFFQVVGHGTKMRMIGYERSLETTSRHFGNVLAAILSLTGEFIKLPEPSATPPDDYKWKWFLNALGALDGCHIDVFVRVADKGRGDHAQNDWKPHVYNACMKHVKETCNIVINKDKILARIKTFDKHYEVINKMLSQSGFGWDWDNNMVSIDSDEVWARYVEVVVEDDEETPELPKKKKQHTADAIMSMVGELRMTFGEALNSIAPLLPPPPPPPAPKVSPSSEILVELKKIQDLVGNDMLIAYGKVTANERTFESLMALPMEMRKAWLMTLP